MTNIYLIRHGQASFGTNNYDNLSDLGHSQARYLGDYFTQCLIQPNHVISGNMTRHHQTRDACLSNMSANLANKSLQISDNWNEFDHENVIAVYRPELAKPEMMKAYLSSHPSPTRAFIELFSQAIEQWQQASNSEQYTESWQQFTQRVADGLSDLLQQATDKNTIFIYTSGGVISAAVMQILSIPKSEFFNINRQLVNCGMTQLQLKRQRLSLITLNEHRYFTGEQHHLFSLI
ncbi:phosphoglycerate mutase family protein [Shewanella inventionis]|uniref:Histidine phosphatase family protein n=1 Tax=Shewanella inventionis TaxID=1738770 RepID=A0ABQ1IR91_9GAMM|nr:histidine phosphatase family protein [Shewanella inventionis]MCL1157197.1 phosphoglycerate mutase family protein [Shewanella inventionis]UAL41945.1 phosphoglycerate mutase family protein [Shewanella inventionis]GGB49096.1 histidine phosphatase family protein [Shewanella inventionis]